MKKGLALLLLLASVVAACQDDRSGVTAPSERALTAASTLGTPQLDFHHARRPVPPGEGVTLRASANSTAQYVCVNKAGRCPATAKKRATATGLVSVTRTFFADADSVLQGGLTLDPTPAPARLCGTGQTPTLTTATYTNLTFANLTTNVVDVSGPHSGTFFTCP